MPVQSPGDGAVPEPGSALELVKVTGAAGVPVAVRFPPLETFTASSLIRKVVPAGAVSVPPLWMVRSPSSQ